MLASRGQRSKPPPVPELAAKRLFPATFWKVTRGAPPAKLGFMASKAAEGAGSGREAAAKRRGELSLLAAFWTFAFALSSVRGIVAGEIPFHLMAPHRLAVMAFGALLCWGMILVLEAAGSRRFSERALLGLGGAGVMSALQSVFHLLSCRVAPIEGYAPMTVAEALNSGLITLAYFVAWTWMHLALVYHRQASAARPGPSFEAMPPPAAASPPGPAERSFWVSRRRQWVRVRADEIVWVEAQKDYVELHAADGGGGMARETMAAVQARLDPEIFVRVHRSAIVRRSEIVALRRKPTGALAVTLARGEEVPVGRSYAKGLRALLGHLRASS